MSKRDDLIKELLSKRRELKLSSFSNNNPYNAQANAIADIILKKLGIVGIIALVFFFIGWVARKESRKKCS